MPWAFEHGQHVCLDILLLDIFCFVFLLTLRHPKRQMMSLLMSLAALQPPDFCHSCRALCEQLHKVFPSCEESTDCRPARAGGKTHTAKCTQPLQGREIWLQESHKSPDFLIRLATAVCACSLPAHGMEMGGCEVGSGGL